MLTIPTEETLEEACTAIPLFPLPSVVLFPNTILRLHVFEPRYVQLLEDCMAGNQLMAIPMLKPASVADGSPIHSVSGVGMVVHCEALEDNRYNIVLLGLRRIHIQEELLSDKMYRLAKAELIQELWENDSFDIASIQTLLTQIIVQNPKLSGSLEVFLKDDVAPDKVLNLLAHIFLQDAQLRQNFIEQRSLHERAQIVEEILAEILLRGNAIIE